jgi:hypothetical protein
MARSLTKVDKAGNSYARPARVEANIDGVLAQRASDLVNRLAVRDQKSPDFIMSETLVHLIRRAIQAGDELTSARVVPVLLIRCERQIRNMVLGNGIDRNSFCEDVLSAFSELLASDGNGSGELDFYECRFNQAFRCFRVDLRKSEVTRISRNLPLPEEGEVNVTREIDRAISIASESDTPEDHVLSHELLHAIDDLPADERRALVLVKIFGYEAESEDRKKTTAATLCGVSGRTIRTRLSKAEARLSRFNLEEDAQ